MHWNAIQFEFLGRRRYIKGGGGGGGVVESDLKSQVEGGLRGERGDKKWGLRGWVEWGGGGVERVGRMKGGGGEGRLKGWVEWGGGGRRERGSGLE